MRTSPPNEPKKKPKEGEPVEGIDLNDFEDKDIAGLELPEEAPPPAQERPRARPPTVDLPDLEPAPAEPAEAQRDAAKRASPLAVAPPPAATRPLPQAAANAEVEAAPAEGASAQRDRTRRAAIPEAAPAAPEAAAEAALSWETVAEAPAEASAPAVVAPAPEPEVPAPRPRPTSVTAAAPVPSPAPALAPYPPQPAAYPPYAQPMPYGYPQPAYGQFGYPPGSYAPYFPQNAAPPPLPPPSPTAEGVARLRIAATLAIGYFALGGLHRAYSAMTGVTDIPGGSQGAPLGMQFMGFFLTACEVTLAALAIAGCSSGVLRMRESKSEARLPPADPSRRPLYYLSAALVIPIVTGLSAWTHLSQVQRSLPAIGAMTNLGLEALYDEYRLTAVAVAAGGLAAAFLAVLGLRRALLHLAPLAPRGAFRQFAWLFVLSAAAHAAASLVLLYIVVNAPVRGQTAAAHPEMLLWLVGPALGALAFLRLRSYLGLLHAEASRRSAPARAK